MKNSNFDHLMERYLTNQVSEEEKTKIEAWLEEVKTDDPQNFEMSADDEDRVFRRITANIDSEDVRPRGKNITFRPWLIGVAATLFVAVVCVGLWYKGKAEVNKIILNDGTLVWLKDQSSIIYFEKVDQSLRVAELTGSGLFEVAKDASRPFILTCGDYKIKVLGTSFNVRPTDAGLEVEVLTGRVSLTTARDSIGIIVESNHRVVYSGHRDAESKPLTREDISTVVQRTEYDMQFENVPLSTIFERIEKKFDVRVSVQNNDILKCKIHADFTDQSLESTMLLISEVVPIEYKIDGAAVSVTGEGCKP